jgi:hypothetical protein
MPTAGAAIVEPDFLNFNIRILMITSLEVMKDIVNGDWTSAYWRCAAMVAHAMYPDWVLAPEPVSGWGV